MLVLTQEPEERIQMGESILELKRGPDGLFVKLKRLGRRGPAQVPLASQIWGLLIQHFTYRLVLDLSQIDLLDSDLVGR